MLTGEVNTRENGFKRRVTIDKGSEIVGTIFDIGTESENEGRKEEEEEEIRDEGCGGLFEDLGGCLMVDWYRRRRRRRRLRWLTVIHGG